MGGESADGTFAAALCMQSRDSGNQDIAFQMSIYPCLDDDLTLDSVRDNDAPLIDSTMLHYIWKNYLGDLFESNHVPYKAVPVRASDYSGTALNPFSLMPG